MQDLLDINDPDWASFKSGDEDWYLAVAGDYLRVYCGWHLWPSITETITQLMIESMGIITLPSRHITDVACIVCPPKKNGWGSQLTSLNPMLTVTLICCPSERPGLPRPTIRAARDP